MVLSCPVPGRVLCDAGRASSPPTRVPKTDVVTPSPPVSFGVRGSGVEHEFHVPKTLSVSSFHLSLFRFGWPNLMSL